MTILTRIFTLLFLLKSLSISAQLTGIISNTKGEPLPFANVYIEGTTQGTTANTEGVYFFELKNGTYHIVFQYIGYKKIIKYIEVKGRTTLNIQLESTEMELSEVVIKANAEDPAYAIIRKAQEMRPFFKNQVPSYISDVYIKGLQRIDDAPSKFFGRDIGTMGGALDTTDGKRQGIVYLSETLSKYYVNGSKKKEILRSSKVSGNPNGFGFNRAELFDFSFYDNVMNIQRDILSPIAESAMGYYKYRFIGSFRDTLGFTVNKIEVIPRRKEDPTWAGYIYIVENQWNIYSTDLYCTGKSIKIDVLDTLRLRQTHVPTKEKIWRPISQTLSFKIGVFGFKINGYFTGIFSNYDLKPVFEKGFFNNEIYKAQKGQLDNNVQYWDTIRPVELTAEERRDYVKKDSLRDVRLTPQYMDSVDRKNNKFKAFSILTGYTYNKSKERWNITWDSPLSTLGFNPIQGWNISSKLSYDKRFGEVGTPYKSSIALHGDINYGFSEKQLRGSGGFSYMFNRFNYATLSVDGGYQMAQYNAQNPVNEFVADIYALYDKKHLRYMYDKKFFKINYSRDIANGLNMNVGWESGNRETDLEVNSQYSLRKKQENYNDNIPLKTTEPNILYFNQQLHQASIAFRWTPDNTYATYPHYKDNEGSKYPIFTLVYNKALKINDASAGFDRLKLRMNADNLKMGLFGTSELRGEYTALFNNKTDLNFIDWNHFNGNETFFNLNLHYMSGFMTMPYYANSTTNNTLTAHWQHNFNGYILDKIPLIRKLRFSEVFRAAYAYTPQLGSHIEFGAGIDNIGWGLFRFLRMDIVWHKGFNDTNIAGKPNFLIGIKL